MRGLTPLYLEVLNLEKLQDQGIEHAGRAAEPGIPVKLHVYPRVPHRFELRLKSGLAKTVTR